MALLLPGVILPLKLREDCGSFLINLPPMKSIIKSVISKAVQTGEIKVASKDRQARTADLIDHNVNKLYSLNEEEVMVVEGRQ